MPAQTPTPLLDTKAAAEFLNVSTKTMERWRWTGEGPRFVKLGGVRYRLEDLQEFIESRVRTSTAER